MKILTSIAGHRHQDVLRALWQASPCKVLLAFGIAGFWPGTGFSAAGATSIAPPDSHVVSSTLNIRENPAEYTIDLALSDRDSTALLDVQMDGRTLRIASGQAPGGVAQEQSFSLPGAKEGVTPTVRREDGHVVITVPKGDAPGAVVRQAPQTRLPQSQKPASASPDSIDAVRDQVLSQLAHMRQQMDEMMNADTDPLGIFGSGGMVSGLAPSTGLFQLKEEKDKYILSARLPEEQAKNIKVAVDNDRVLKITSEENNSSSSGGFGSFTSSNFSQSLSLPGPVKTDQGSMNYKDGRFEITLPKS